MPADLQRIAANLAAPIPCALASGVSAFADATGSGESSGAASSTVSGMASTGSPVSTGAAGTLNMGAGAAAALAMLAVLAL